jgi:hypothetical protein
MTLLYEADGTGFELLWTTGDNFSAEASWYDAGLQELHQSYARLTHQRQ